MLSSPRARGLWAAVVTVAIWSSFIVIARASASRTLAPLDIAFARIIGASVILVPWGWWRVRQRRAQGIHHDWLGVSPLPWRITALTGLFGGLLYAMLAYTGFFFAPAAHASVLMPGSLPLWTALLAVVLLGEKLTPWRIAGLACIVLGDVFVGGASIWKALTSPDGGTVWRGDALFMTAALCWSLYSVLARKLALDAVDATIAITVFALVTYVPAYALAVATGALNGIWPSRLAEAPWAEIVFQAVVQGWLSVVVSGITFTLMIRHFGPVKSTMITALVPGLSALGAVVFLGEPLGWNLIAGLALVTLGIAFGVRAVAAKPAA